MNNLAILLACSVALFGCVLLHPCVTVTAPSCLTCVCVGYLAGVMKWGCEQA